MSKHKSKKHDATHAELFDAVMPGDSVMLSWPDDSMERVKVIEFYNAADLHKPTRVKIERLEDQDYGANNEDKVIVVPLCHLTPIPH